MPREPFATVTVLPADGEGVGLNEATARVLGHGPRIEGGRIADHPIVAPTSWHFSPRDAAGRARPAGTGAGGCARASR